MTTDSLTLVWAPLFCFKVNLVFLQKAYLFKKKTIFNHNSTLKEKAENNRLEMIGPGGKELVRKS